MLIKQVDYKAKYLKYKAKYLRLKKEIGGRDYMTREEFEDTLPDDDDDENQDDKKQDDNIKNEYTIQDIKKYIINKNINKIIISDGKNKLELKYDSDKKQYYEGIIDKDYIDPKIINTKPKNISDRITNWLKKLKFFEDYLKKNNFDKIIKIQIEYKDEKNKLYTFTINGEIATLSVE
jgi:hypothetical protein